MPNITAAYQELLRHAAVTASPQSIRPVAAAIVARWQQAAQALTAPAELRRALLDLRERLTGAAQQAAAAGCIFERKALEDAIHVLDTTSSPSGTSQP